MADQQKTLQFVPAGRNVEIAEDATHYTLRIPKNAQGVPSHGLNGQPGKSMTLATTFGRTGYTIPALGNVSIAVRMSKWGAGQ